MLSNIYPRTMLRALINGFSPPSKTHMAKSDNTGSSFHVKPVLPQLGRPQISSRRRNGCEFIALLAHELRNPLAPIRTAVELMGKIGDPRYSMVHAIVDRQSAQLHRLVNDLIDISRITRGTLELTRARVNLNEVVRQA